MFVMLRCVVSWCVTSFVTCDVARCRCVFIGDVESRGGGTSEDGPSKYAIKRKQSSLRLRSHHSISIPQNQKAGTTYS
jgi:hypothetical protein